MSHSVCRWWAGRLPVSPIRRLWQDPRVIVGPYVRRGVTVLEPGPFFSLELVRLAGLEGRVVAVDVQPRMLETLRRRAARAGLLSRMDTRVSGGASLGIEDLAQTLANHAPPPFARAVGGGRIVG